MAESGGLHPVLCLADARAALATIVNQGEGLQDGVFADAAQSELTHFSKLAQLSERLGRGQGDAVLPLPPNPRLAACPDSALALLARCFNAAYGALLLTLQELYAESDRSGHLNARMYTLMEKVRALVAILLLFLSFSLSLLTMHLLCFSLQVMRPVGVLMCQRGFGPTFEGTVFPGPPIEHVKELCRQAVALFPAELEKTAAGLAKLG